MIVPTCARCDRPFPANHELASLPHGRRVAFDPELGRVWRICTKCGEWNLIGPDAAGSVVTELTKRLPRIDAGAIIHDAIGSVGVVMISTNPGAVATNPHASRARANLPRLKILDRGMNLVFGALFLAAAIPMVASEHFPGQLHYLVPILVGSLGGWLGGKQLVRWARVRRVDSMQVRLAAALGVVALLLALVLSNLYTVFGVASVIAFTMVIELAGDHFFGRLAGQLLASDGGEQVWIAFGDADRVDIGLAADGSTIVAWFDRGMHQFTGLSAHRLLETVGSSSKGGPSRSEVEQGWLLLRTHGTASGVLTALDEARPEAHARHTLADLPHAWQVAIHFAIVEASGTDAERDVIRDQIAAASEVAAIAESLDAGSDASRLKPRLGEPKH